MDKLFENVMTYEFKKKQEKEIKNDKYIPTNRRMSNQEADLSMKKRLCRYGEFIIR